jgi:hypothetical protein
MFKIAIVIVAAVTISGALAVLRSPRNAGVQVTPINPTAMMQQAKDLPVDPSYPAF